MIQLGNKVKDKVSGFTGIATSTITHLNGCVRIGIQAKVDKDGKIPEIVWLDQEQLEVIDNKYNQKQKNTGGPGDTYVDRNIPTL